jgi:hypothetical protein
MQKLSERFYYATERASEQQFVVEHAEEILAALRKAEADEWRPISEVGTREHEQLILGHAKKKWVRFGRKFPGIADWYYSGTNERSQYAQMPGDAPTHFMPIPPPPEEKT